MSSDAVSGIVYIHYPRDFTDNAADEIKDMKSKQLYPRVRVMMEDYALTRKSIRQAKQQ